MEGQLAWLLWCSKAHIYTNQSGFVTIIHCICDLDMLLILFQPHCDACIYIRHIDMHMYLNSAGL